MNAFRNILVPTDFSEGAELAVERALSLAQGSATKMTLFHVYELPAPYLAGYVFTAEITRAIEDSARIQLTKAKQLADERAQALAGSDGVPSISTKLTLGTPVTSILDEAQSGDYDLLVMGTHGRTGLSHMFIGSVAERVIRAASCPVLTVRPSSSEVPRRAQSSTRATPSGPAGR